MKQTVLITTILAVACAALFISRAHAQCNPTCQGDFNLDGEVTVDEVIVSVNNALQGCESPEEQGCLESGGTVTTVLCCASVVAFPDTCGIGPCGCAPQFSHEVRSCECGEGKCYDATGRMCVPRQ